MLKVAHQNYSSTLSRVKTGVLSRSKHFMFYPQIVGYDEYLQQANGSIDYSEESDPRK